MKTLRQSFAKIIALTIIMIFSGLWTMQYAAVHLLNNPMIHEKETPPNWKQLVKKDFDGGFTLMVMKQNEEDIDPTDGQNRLLMVLKKDGNNMMKVTARTETAIMCKDCGGVTGDPFVSAEIDQTHQLVIRHIGGSNWRWEYTHKFQFIDGEWKLVYAQRDYYNVSEPDLTCRQRILEDEETGFISLNEFDIYEEE